jgi:hypothetical protein
MKLKQLIILSSLLVANASLFCAQPAGNKQDTTQHKTANEKASYSAALVPKKTIYQAVKDGDYPNYAALMKISDENVAQGKLGININTPEDNKNNTLLILAAKALNNNPNDNKISALEMIIQDLIKRKANLGAQENATENTALHIVLQSSHGKNIALRLIKAMNDLEITNKEGNTPLHIIALQQASPNTVVNNIELAQALINNFVTRSPKNKAGKTPLALAQQKFDELSKGSVTASALAGLGYEQEENMDNPRPSDGMVKFLTKAVSEENDQN